MAISLKAKKPADLGAILVTKAGELDTTHNAKRAESDNLAALAAQAHDDAITAARHREAVEAALAILSDAGVTDL